MLDQARKQPRSAKRIVTALRSLLRFLHVDGILAVPLAGAVPSPAGHALAGLPRALEPGQVEAMLASCDPATATGRRDRAVLLLLSRMGLRAGEVAGLGLDDIDWRRGEITVRGKGSRRDRLPLPADVGAAIVAYLRDGRPAGALDRTVFIAAQAPREALSYAGITTIVAEAAARAGVPGPVHAHRLRHSAATAMLRGGGSLTEIGQALRHARPATTAIYAKVDIGALRPLGRPWPGQEEARMTADGRPLRDSLEDYLALRRALGFRLKTAGRLLGQFVSWLEDRGAGTITTEDALAWAVLPPGASQAWQAIRLSAVRGFAAYLHGTDPSVQVPPAGLIRRGNDRATPYIYSDAEISAIIAAAGALRPRFRAATYQALISLLAPAASGSGKPSPSTAATSTRSGHAHRPPC